MGGLYSTLGNIGTLLGRKPSPRTPPFLPPVGPSAPMPPPVPPVNSDPEDDQSYDYNAPPASPAPSTSSTPPSSPATAVGGIGSRPQYQSAEDTLQHTLSHPPERPKTSLGRQIGGALLMGTGSPIGQTLGSRIAYGQYPQQLAQYQADVANQTAAADQARKTAEEQRKIEQNQNQTAESRARREDLAETRRLNREASGEKSAEGLLSSGAATIAPPIPGPQTHDVAPPPGVPGLAPTQATVPSPPEAPNVKAVGGMRLQIGKKPTEIKTIEEGLLSTINDPTLTPEQSQQKQDILIKAYNALHPKEPIQHIVADDFGNATAVSIGADGTVKKIPLGKLEKTKTQPDTQRKDLAAGLKAYEPSLASAQRMNIMTKNYEDAVKNHDQQAMLSLLANHLGMTMGLQKGARLNQAIIAEAEKSRPWLQGMVAKFDKDGYLSGLTLTPGQMQQMVNLGRESFAESMVKSKSEAEYQDIHEGPKRVPSSTTMNYYIGMAGGNAARAKAMAAADGWSVQ